jgi:hypothetical protein
MSISDSGQEWGVGGMNILQIGPIPPHIGGATTGGVATHLWSLSTNLARRGHQVGILANNYHSYQQKIEVDGNGVIIYGLARPAREVATFHMLEPAFWKKVILTKSHFGTFLSWRNVVRNLLAYQPAKGFRLLY